MSKPKHPHAPSCDCGRCVGTATVRDPNQALVFASQEEAQAFLDKHPHLFAGSGFKPIPMQKDPVTGELSSIEEETD